MQQLIFSVVLVYTWAVSMFVDDEALLTASRGSLLYWALVAPAVVIVLTNLDNLLLRSYQRSTLSLAVFAVVVTAVSIIRGDIATATSVLPLCATLIAIKHGQLRATLGLINALFISSMIATLVIQALGSPRYGVIPGYSLDVEWRVSLFPYNITPSWLFALVVFFVNYFRNPNSSSRIVMMTLAFYFIALAASRTAIIVLALVIAFLALTQLAPFRDRALYRWLLPAVVGLFMLVLGAQALVTLLVSVDDPFLNAVLFRSESGAASVDAAMTSIYRTIMWGVHFEAFLQNPLFGVGTFEFAELSPDHQDVSGSEAFITGLLARTGLAALLVFYFVYRITVDAARSRDRLAFALAITFAITSLTYGSYIVPYNFILLVLFGAMNLPLHGRQAAASQEVVDAGAPLANSS